MNEMRLRYEVEHQLLPNVLFDNPKEIISMLSLEKEKFICLLYDIVSKSGKIPNPYKKENFAVRLYKLERPWLMAKIVMPEPDSSPLCGSVIIVFEETFKKVYYFTIEKEVKLSKNDEDRWALCGWTKHHEHLNFGEISGGESEEIKAIRELIAQDNTN